jgi:RNA polymerase sigma factor (sigma-70 family)
LKERATSEVIVDDPDDLVVGAQRGEPAALRSLYDSIAPRVRGYLQLRGVDDPDAATNEVFLRLFSRLGSVTGGLGGARALAFTIAHGLAVDDARSRGRRPVSTPYETQDDLRTSVSAEDIALEHTGTSEVLAVLDLLPDDQRNVVILRVLGELSIAETAAAIGRTEPTVKRLQSRAIEALRHLLDRPVGMSVAGKRGIR